MSIQCEAGDASFKNKKSLKENTVASCFCCCKSFKVESIKEWCDHGETALCPLCGIDSVLPGKVDEEVLKVFCEQSFSIKK
jgi:hypothetical protein